MSCDKMGGGKCSAQRGASLAPWRKERGQVLRREESIMTKRDQAGRRPVLYSFKDSGVQLGNVSMGGSHGEI